MIRILVVGSRSLTNIEYLSVFLDKFISDRGYKNEDVEIISGGASGTDALAKRYAENNGLKYTEFPAEWDKYGRKAGYIRNRKMHEYIAQVPCRVCIAFWDGESKGTQHSFSLAKEFDNELVVDKFRDLRNGRILWDADESITI